jgi:hypothetical protein
MKKSQNDLKYRNKMKSPWNPLNQYIDQYYFYVCRPMAITKCKHLSHVNDVVSHEGLGNIIPLLSKGFLEFQHPCIPSHQVLTSPLSAELNRRVRKRPEALRNLLETEQGFVYKWTTDVRQRCLLCYSQLGGHTKY